MYKFSIKSSESKCKFSRQNIFRNFITIYLSEGPKTEINRMDNAIVRLNLTVHFQLKEKLEI